jgi:hypothetical protein
LTFTGPDPTVHSDADPASQSDEDPPDQQNWSKFIKECVCVCVRVVTWDEGVWKIERNPGFPSFM